LLLEELKEERNYQLRPQLCGLFLFNEVMMKNSLKKNSDFRKVYSEGKSIANRYLVMYVLSNGLDSNRLGISVSKKIGNSVVRHHLTRLIRESYRLNSNMFNSGLDIVVVARVASRDKNYKEIESAFLHLSKLHNIISN